MTTTRTAHQQLTDHRHYKYRGCAPDPDTPGYSAADPDLPLDAWVGTTADGGMNSTERAAQQRSAVAICNHCPVLAECRTYALTLDATSSDGILGGLTYRKRRRIQVKSRRKAEKPQPRPGSSISEASRKAKIAVLRQLARETDPELVAYRAGMDLRTANWHRSRLCSDFGLDQKRTTREQLLQAAVAHGFLPPSTRIKPDGAWPIAAAPNGDGSRQRLLAPGRSEQTTLAVLLITDHTPTPRKRRRSSSKKAPASKPFQPTLTQLALARPVPLLLPVRALEARAA